MINELINNDVLDRIKSDNSLKDSLIKELGIKPAIDLSDESKLHEASTDDLKSYIAQLRNEMSQKNNKVKSKEEELSIKLQELEQRERERLDNEKLSQENKLKDEKKYKELLESIEKERNELKFKYSEVESKLSIYEQRELTEKSNLLQKFSAEEQEKFKSLDVDTLRFILSRTDKQTSSPVSKQSGFDNVTVKTLNDLRQLPELEKAKWIETNQSQFEELLRIESQRR